MNMSWRMQKRHNYKTWAREEMADAVILWSANLLEGANLTAHEEYVIRQQRDRVLKFLHQEHALVQWKQRKSLR
jgi:hypothetical protein